jgi:hypothetical protein
MQKWPDTPVGDEALYQLGTTLEKEGKKYSAAQAFTAVVLHYPGTTYASKAKYELKKLHQPVDTEEDPLRLVLTESGFGDTDQVTVRQGGDTALASAADSNAYPPLPLLKAPPPPASDADAPGSIGPTGGTPAVDPPSSISSGAAAPVAAVSGDAGDAVSGSGASLAATLSPAGKAAPEAVVGAVKTAALKPATLNKVRLSSADPPLSVIFDLTSTVPFESQLQNASSSSTLTIHLKETKPASRLATHLVFDRSIFRDCDIQTDAGETTVTVNTSPVSRFAVIPLNAPPRLLVTFTPQEQQPAGTVEPTDQGANSNSID